MSFIRTESASDGILTIWLDGAGERMNTLSRQMWAELSEVIEQLAHDKPARAIIASAKSGSFAVGVDPDEFRKMSDAELDEYIRTGQQVLGRLQHLFSVMTVAAINGDCLGGGLELAMACRARACVDAPSIRIGLPNTKRGLVPMWGGTFLMRQLVGLEESIMLTATGQILDPQRAARIGLVDQIVPAEQLMNAAAGIHKQQEKKGNSIDPRRIFEWADQQIRSRFPGDQAIAPLKAIQIMRNGMMHGENRELSDEREVLLELRHLPIAQNAMETSFGDQLMIAHPSAP